MKSRCSGNAHGLTSAKCCDMLLCKVGDTELREAFEALCVLRAFDDDRMSPLLGIYHGDPAAWTPEKCAPIRMAMVRTRLTRWAKDRSGYVMDEGVRRILEWLLRESKAELWRQLHSAAYRLYEEWARLPGPAKQCWQDEAAHHAAELENAGVDQVSKGE